MMANSLLNDINNFLCTVEVTPDHNAATCFSVPEPTEVPYDTFQYNTITEFDVLLTATFGC